MASGAPYGSVVCSSTVLSRMTRSSGSPALLTTSQASPADAVADGAAEGLGDDGTGDAAGDRDAAGEEQAATRSPMTNATRTRSCDIPLSPIEASSTVYTARTPSVPFGVAPVRTGSFPQA